MLCFLVFDDNWLQRRYYSSVPAIVHNINHKTKHSVKSKLSTSIMDTDSSVMRLRLKRFAHITEGFGFGLNIQDRGTPPVLQINSLVKECEAQKSGLIRSGDIILRINNVDVSKCTYDEAIQTLASTPMNAFASFTVRAPYGFVTRLVTTFEENGHSKTIRITERARHNQMDDNQQSLPPTLQQSIQPTISAIENNSSTVSLKPANIPPNAIARKW